MVRCAIRWRAALAALGMAAIAAGCVTDETPFEEAVEDLGRLAVLNGAMVTQVVSADDACGFESAAVRDAAVLTGEPGGLGALELTTEACALELGALEEVISDCSDAETRLGGRVVVWATLRMEGLVTGNPMFPILPQRSDAVSVTLHEARFDHFQVQVDGFTSTVREGSLSGRFSPRLAVGSASGACTVITPNVTVEDLVYYSASLVLEDDEELTHLYLASSNLSAQVGAGADAENTLRGTLLVYDRTFDLARDPPLPLDPEYDPTTFVQGYACTPDLELPVRFDCGT